MVKLPSIISRLLKRAHPDIYEAAKSYAEARGIDVSDVIASAISAYLSADEQGKEELEKAMAERRLRHGSSIDIKGAVNMLRDFMQTFSELSKTIAETRANFQISQIISDYKAISEAAKEISQIGQSKGSGSLEDLIAQAMINRLLGGLGTAPQSKEFKKTGKANVEKIEE